MNVIKIVLVDDHQIVRDGIKAMLLTNKEIKVVAEADDYKSLMKILKEQTPDVLILDISMPGKSGVEITRELKEKDEDIKILMLSASTDEEHIVDAIQAGANGFLPKDTSKEEFVEAVKTVYNNEEYFGAKLSKIIFNSYTHHVKSKSSKETALFLTDRETDTLKLFADGYSSKEIAEKLFISPRTVESHKANILKKLKMKSSVDLIKYAIRQGIVRL